MSIDAPAVEQEAAKAFIDNFVEKSSGVTFTNVHSLPKRPSSIHCSKEEVEGECRSFALEYLRDSEAPDIVSTTLARLATDRVLAQDLTSLEEDVSVFKEVERKDDDDDDDDEDESKKERITIKAFNCGNLAVKTLNVVHEICKEWKTNMPALKKSKHSYEVYVHSEQNTRRRMEDKHIVVTEFNNLFGLGEGYPSQAYFAVFDGHGGVECACYTVAHFHNNIVRQEKFSDDLDEALRQAFLTTDKMFIRKAHHENLRAGSTCVVAFLRGNTLHIGWLGDSQVSLCKRGGAVKLMEPHKPNRKDERERIKSLGGCVVWIGDWRVNGNIAVSRSIGDKDHKPFVSGDPDTLEFDLEGDEEYLVLGCDGLWDTIQPPDVISMVQEHLANGGARSQVARFLVDRAIAHGSTDNVTVIVVFLDCHRKPVEAMQVEEQSQSEEIGAKEETGAEASGGNVAAPL